MRIVLVDVHPEKGQTTQKVSSPRLYIIVCLHHLLQNMILFATLIVIAEILEEPHEKRSIFPLLIMGAVQMIFHLAYTYLYTQMQKTPITPPVTKNTTDVNTEDAKSGVSFLTTLMTPVFNFLGSSVAICSGGTCTAMYGSTLSAIFGAFGITITEWLPYLDGLTGLLVFVSVYVLWSAKRDYKYKPFLLGVVGAVLIISYLVTSQYKIMLYIGNVMMVVAALWNIKLNRVRWGRAKGKSSKV